MTEMDDLDTAFPCAAHLGTFGDAYEKPMEAMVNAATKTWGDPGECNEGYLRDDALLVITIITDEWDGPGDPEGITSAGDPQSWYDAVVQAKGGFPENVVVLSLISYPGGDCPPPMGLANFDCTHIKDFTEMFGQNGVVGGICVADWSSYFQQAIGVIDSACENFVPPAG
jgi:hypothetical protein